jgi:glycosyltransferase involved in cell wall biosynthesis
MEESRIDPAPSTMQRFSSQVWNSSQEVVEPLSTVTDSVTLSKAERVPHVLFLIDHLLARGGGEGNLLKVVQLMPPDRVRCSIATLKIKPAIQESISVPVYVFPLRRVYGFSGFRAAWRLRRLIRREKIDIVQTYFETANLWGGLVAKLSGALLLSSRRDMGILRKPKHRLGYQLINRITDRVLAVSEEVKRFCVGEDRVAPDKVSVIYNGVDLQQIAEAASGASSPVFAEFAGRQIVTCVANLRRVKGVDVFLRAAHLVCQELPDTLFLVAGSLYEEGYSREVRGLVESLGLQNNVRFLEFVENPVPLLKMSSVFCMLSRSEGFCNALLEAMACGVPSVVSRVGGNPEAIKDGESGFLVPVEDHETAAQRMLFLLRNPDQASKMGEAGRQAAFSQFSATAMINNLISLYSELMAKRGRNK